MTSAFFIPTVNLMGAGCLKDAADSIQSQGFKKGLIVTDKILSQIGMVKQVQDMLSERDVETVVFDGTQPNPTISNVNDGLSLLADNECDFVISLAAALHTTVQKVSLWSLQMVAKSVTTKALTNQRNQCYHLSQSTLLQVLHLK